jgi:hypothetical protein
VAGYSSYKHLIPPLVCPGICVRPIV